VTSQDDVPVARRHVRWARVAAIAAAAASLAVAIWINQRQSNSADLAVAGWSVILVGAERARVATVIRAGHIAVPDSIALLSTPPGGAAGTPAPLNLQTPIGTAVASTTPTFTWEGAPGGAYSIAIFDENFSEVARARVEGTSWRSPSELKRGATYVWQVTAQRETPGGTEPKPAPAEARFMIVDERTAARATWLQERLAADPLSLGILLAEEGLIADAHRQLMRAADVPETADVARRLIASLPQGPPATTKPAQ